MFCDMYTHTWVPKRDSMIGMPCLKRNFLGYLSLSVSLHAEASFTRL